jgi:hypothetical protein
MDWANERYVRVYTRDTEDDLLLSWEATALWHALIRKVDRAGVLEAKRGARSLALVTRIPIDVVERSLPELLADGRLAAHELGYLVPNFIEAQETPQSDKQRATESRGRRRDRGRHAPSRNVTSRHAESRAVTERDGAVTERDSNVTPSHAPSHDVTSCHSLQSGLSRLSDPDQGEPAPARDPSSTEHGARSTESPPPLPQPPPPPVPAPRESPHGERQAAQATVPVSREGSGDSPAVRETRAAWEAVWSEHQETRAEVARELADHLRLSESDIRAIGLAAFDPGRKDLQQRVAELQSADGLSLEAAIERCRVVLAKTAADCREKQTLRFLDGEMWTAKKFYKTAAIPAGDRGAKPRAGPRSQPASTTEFQPRKRL